MFFRIVQSLTEQDEYIEDDSVFNSFKSISTLLRDNKYMNSYSKCGHRDLNSRSNQIESRVAGFLLHHMDWKASVLTKLDDDRISFMR